MILHFFKYQGTGNDFIILDNRKGEIDFLSSEIVKQLCDRKFGIGADGLMLMNSHEPFDFEMIYLNADGNKSTMCGNGGRCMIKFASDIGINKPFYKFLAVDGEHEAEIENQGLIKLRMKDVSEIEIDDGHYILNTGSPHFVKITSQLNNVDVNKIGSEIRFNDRFKKEGINVNFVEALEHGTIFVRTFERGVEQETLSCGTGVTAAALVSANNECGYNRIAVKTLGGQLSVEFNKIDTKNFNNIWLCGPAKFVFKGEITLKNLI